jgi:DNA-binding XRE family transcriptional regulator
MQTRTNDEKPTRSDTRVTQNRARGSASVPDPTIFNETLYRRVRELRAGAGLTQAAAAAALGINRRTYIHFEKRSPLPAHLIVTK